MRMGEIRDRVGGGVTVRGIRRYGGEVNNFPVKMYMHLETMFSFILRGVEGALSSGIEESDFRVLSTFCVNCSVKGLLAAGISKFLVVHSVLHR